MWRTWANLSLDEIERLKTNVIQNIGILKDAHDIPSSFSLALFDHKKCPTTELKIHTKQDLQTGVGVRGIKYSSALWNIQRPYLRCVCPKDARTGCKGDIMWFDHAIWYMINHLSTFFPDTDFPTLTSKFVAFFIWLSNAARIAVQHQVSFTYARELIAEAALEFTTDPKARLLTRHPDGPGLERLIKPATFTATNPGTSPGFAGKRARSTININASPDQPLASPPGYSQTTGYRGSIRHGHGGYNKKFRPSSQPPSNSYPALQNAPGIRGGYRTPGPNEAFVYLTPASHRSTQGTRQPYMVHSPEPSLTQGPRRSPNVSSTSSRSPKPMRQEASHPRALPRFNRPTMKGRVLDWDNVDH
jgi:hypothetical protein